MLASNGWCSGIGVALGLAMIAVAAGCSCGTGTGTRRDSGLADGGGGGFDTGTGDTSVVRDDTGLPPGPDAGPCSATAIEAEEGTRAVDIIWVIDNSGSMGREEDLVQANMNTFAGLIGGFGIDYHVIVITDTGSVSITLDEPTRLLQVNRSIGSNDAFERVIETYPMYQSFLRAGAVRHIVVVSDDDSDMSESMFLMQLAALPAPGFPPTATEPYGVFLHAIVAEDPPFCTPFGIPCPCTVSSCPCIGEAAARGQTYIDMQMRTGGVFASLCQTDWTPIFDALATAATMNTMLPCNFDIPPAPDGMTLDYMEVNLQYTPSGGTPEYVPQVPDLGACTGSGGWYYDDPAMPTRVIACPTTCDRFEADSTGMVDLAFGCATILI